MNEWKDLGKRQEQFADAFGQLLAFAATSGIKVRIKDAYRDPRLHGAWGKKAGYGAAYSVHKLSLAVDLYTKNTADHIRLHAHWEKLGGAAMIDVDMNHYSCAWQGYR